MPRFGTFIDHISHEANTCFKANGFEIPLYNKFPLSPTGSQIKMFKVVHRMEFNQLN